MLFPFFFTYSSVDRTIGWSELLFSVWGGVCPLQTSLPTFTLENRMCIVVSWRCPTSYLLNSWTSCMFASLYFDVEFTLYNLSKLDWKRAYKWRKRSLPGVWLNFAPVESIVEWMRVFLRNSSLNPLLVHAHWVWFIFLPYCLLMDRRYRVLN